MFGKRCTLCGGRLDGRLICTECGLNNSKSEKYYKVNKSSCDGQPLTHVHEDTGKRDKSTDKRKPESRQKNQQKRGPEQYTWQDAPGNAGKRKKAGWVGKLVTAFVVMSIAGTVIGSLVGVFTDGFSEYGDSYEEPDPYETALENGYELSEYGEDLELRLTSGKYIVGVHIPEGSYRAEEMEEYDAVKINDPERSIYLYEYPAKEGDSYLDDLRLFEGAFVEITAQDAVTLTTGNAQPLESMENPLTKEYEFEGDIKKTAGTDFEAGVYDLQAIQGAGEVKIDIYDESDEDSPFATENIYIGENSSDGLAYKNVIIPEGAELTVEDYTEGEGERLILDMTPSPAIESEDYLETYKESY